jgi:ABC-type sulfate/molybdate transport systems ATPase subunit
MDHLEIDIALARRSFDLRVALNLAAGVVALVGPSGAGKTSLLRAVAGLDRPFEGRIAFGGETWFDGRSHVHLPPQRRRVGFVPQDYALFPHLTVAGNVRFGGRRDRPDLLRRLGIEHLAAARPHQLSGGERQRVALARALARFPRVLLLDEPFGALDPVTRREVRDELAGILDGLALTTALVTHSFEDATALAGRIGVLDQGRLLQMGTARELVSAPADATVAAITGANIVGGVGAASAPAGLVRLLGGGELTVAKPVRGDVQVAVHPWRIELADPAGSPVTDTVVSVHQERGGRVIRCTRFRIDLADGRNGHLALEPGALVGLRVAPEDVHVFGAAVTADARSSS